MPGKAPDEQDAQVDEFIDRWRVCEGGQERANYALFLTELCRVIGVAPPDPANADPTRNDYVFERVVDDPHFREDKVSQRRIDLYKRDCFVLEAKQSRKPDGSKVPRGEIGHAEPGQVGTAAWDTLMVQARRQAESYARALPADHDWPPFLLVCDVGHCIEVYADFSRQGRNYAHFPNRQGFRIDLAQLKSERIRNLLKAIWERPLQLDPSKASAQVTHQIAQRLAGISKTLENAGHTPEEVSKFLMRCIFTMFAEDTGLLPSDSFRDLLAECKHAPESFVPMVTQLWQAMDKGEFAIAIKAKVKWFNGKLFDNVAVIPLRREEIGELEAAARHDWKSVEPAIFGTLLEQALDREERKRLGAFYTPRAYVERLVSATVMEPMWAEWNAVLATAGYQKAKGSKTKAIKTLKRFHDRLCELRVLDPACGTGNFLYVAMELLKQLEGEVLEAITRMSGEEYLPSLQSHTVDPHQFLGIEVNARAAEIAALVLWIGYLQWHIRITSAPVSEPVLRAFKTIEVRDAVLERPEWPEAEFIVGNPPFIGGNAIRARLGSNYADQLQKAHKHMNSSADYVMYWWDMAADSLVKTGTKLQRFGFVTTNSITQPFQRRVVERHLRAKKQISLVLAIPDHPWTKASKGSASVRIAMTVAESGTKNGRLLTVVEENNLDSDTPSIQCVETFGAINANLSVGTDITKAGPLRANKGGCCPGVKLHGSGFIVTPAEAEYLGLGTIAGLEQHIRPYRNGRDLNGKPRNVFVIDLFGLSAEDVRVRLPEIYQHVALNVKPERDHNNRGYRRENWWLFGENVPELRKALAALPRYIATAQTAKHRVFTFLDASILPDNAVIAIASDDPLHLGVLSSRIHLGWALSTGSRLGIGNDSRYLNSLCFDTFPFPVHTDSQAVVIRDVAEKLDRHRKNQMELYPHLTLTDMYNVLEKYRADSTISKLSPKEQAVFRDGLVLLLKEYHDELDRAVCRAYGLPDTASDQAVIDHLVRLNAERLEEERDGLIHWLRPAFQKPKYAKPTHRGQEREDHSVVVQVENGFPDAEPKQIATVMSVLLRSSKPLTSHAIAALFAHSEEASTAVTNVLESLMMMGFVECNARGEYQYYSPPPFQQAA